MTVEEVIRYTIKTVSGANVPIDVKLILLRGLTLFIEEQKISDEVKDRLLSDIALAMSELPFPDGRGFLIQRLPIGNLQRRKFGRFPPYCSLKYIQGRIVVSG